MKKAKLKRRWLIFSIAGLLLTGFGLSLTGEAILLKYAEPQGWGWVLAGTLALIVFNSGLCLFGQGVLYKAKIDRKNEK